MQFAAVASQKAPFDRIKGELIQGLGAEYVLVPASKWRETDMWGAACSQALQSFRASGVLFPTFSDDTVLVQEYHGLDKIAFIFAHPGWPDFQVDPDWLYFIAVIELSPPLKAHLVLTNRWKSPTRH